MMKMRIFGEFALYGRDALVDEKTLHSNKLVRLLAYILLHRDRDLTRQELIDTFWADDGSKNPECALKNLVYRLRNELKVLGEGELILTVPGAYRWNPDVRVETDYESMDRAAKAARAAEDPKSKREWCERAISCYRNEVSPRIASESWMLSRITYYRIVYTDTMKLLIHLCMEASEWERAELLCREALAIDVLDEELHECLIRSCIGRKDYETAMESYETARRIFYDQLGIREVGRFRDLYDEILALSDHRTASIGSLLESVGEEDVPQGAFACEYPVFRELYRVEARRIRRTGVAEYILLITMKKSGKFIADGSDASIKEGMQALADFLTGELRIGDVVARYSSTQYVVLLPTCTYESALMVAQRIERQFRSKMGKKRLTLSFEVEEVQSASGQSVLYKEQEIK